MLRSDESGWSNPKVLTIFVVIFLCGAGFGAVVTREVLHSRLASTAAASTDNGMETARRFGLEALTKRLNLTPEQVNTVTRELDEYAKYYQNIEDQRADVAELGRQRIERVLTEDQRKTFHALLGDPKH